MRIVPAFGLGSPAAVDLGRCDRVLVDPFQWFKLDSGERSFILAHERAHCLHGIEDEAEADAYALQAITQAGINPKNGYEAIVKTLDLERPDHAARADVVRQASDIMPAEPFELVATDPVVTNENDPSPARGNDIDWQTILEQGIDVGGDVLSDLLAAYYGRNNPQPQPQPQRSPGGPNMTLLLVVAAAIVLLLIFLKK